MGSFRLPFLCIGETFSFVSTVSRKLREKVFPCFDPDAFKIWRGKEGTCPTLWGGLEYTLPECDSRPVFVCLTH